MKKAIDYYKGVVKKYAEFEGRATRSEYWYFTLVNMILCIALSVVGNIVSKDMGSMLQGLYSLAVLLPGIAVAVRRLHDTERSAWWLLINLIPLVGTIVFIVFLATDSKPGNNKYGPYPKV